MIITDTDILKEKEKGNIIISPFEQENLKNSMYDVTLGEYYCSFSGNHGIWSPSSASSISDYWEVKKAVPFSSLGLGELKDFKDDDLVIFILPGQLILGHTQEFIGSVSGSNITTHMNSRSTMGRCGLRFCLCSGLGDIGYFNRWTMEIENGSQLPILLKVGTRVASITFSYTSSPPIDNYRQRGSYTTDHNLDDLKSNWKPEMMIPKAT